MTDLHPLESGWQLARTSPGSCEDPPGINAVALDWHPAAVPGTVAQALHRDLATACDYDADDWWYRTTFAAPAQAGKRQWLRFPGLATLAQVWLNNEPILDSRNMFRGHRVEVTQQLRDVNHLVIRFRALREELGVKRPRPRWKTALVESQNLRWIRTTLLGRMPGWTPAIPPVGPWGGVSLECAQLFDVSVLDLQARAESGRGHVLVRAAVANLTDAHLEEARLRVGERVFPLRLLYGHEARIHAELDVGEVPLWWPHTHDEPRLLDCSLELRAAGLWQRIDCGKLGFREIAVDAAGGRVQLRVNGVPVFCRGTCWSTADILALRAPREALRTILTQARDAGMNMIRVGGTMCYESDDFYALCDELGILVWQDFMFANMDYPLADARFRAEVEAEAHYQLLRLQRHACIAAYCGGSEVAQQAAMMGLPESQWSHELFDELLPRLVQTHHPGVSYFPSTPWGGPLPFHVSTGLAHYYGVGAYRRPLSDVKSARVSFATECLGFANVPEPPFTNSRVPRDNGASWDFQDIRDHYLREVFGLDPVALRSQDPQRYYALSRMVSGEVMRRVFAEWRAPASGCGGGLVWLHRDVWPGAGWGITDSTGRPKAAYWYLKRAWASQALHLTDEGCDGVAIHVVNDAPRPLDAHVDLELLRDSGVAIASATRALQLTPHGASTLSADALLGRFTDIANAYRFGPAAHAVVAARLRLGDGTVLAEDFLFPSGALLPQVRGARLDIECSWLDASRVAVTLRSDSFLQAVHLECEGFEPDDNYFHLRAACARRVVFTRTAGNTTAFKVAVTSLNADMHAIARLPEPSGAANAPPAPGSNSFVAC